MPGLMPGLMPKRFRAHLCGGGLTMRLAMFANLQATDRFPLPAYREAAHV